MTTEITKVLEKEVSPVVKEAQKLAIRDEKGMISAVESLSRLNILSDRITEEKEKITVPAQAVLTAERKRWAPLEKPLKEAIDLIRNKMSEYQSEQTRLAREEEARIAARVKEGKGNLSIDTAMKRMSEIERPTDRVVADSGTVKFREQQVLKIVEPALIPSNYMVPDEDAIFDALDKGIEVPGCVLDLKMIPINNR